MASWYRKLDAGIWGDEKFRRLSRPQPNAQYLWIYLLTGQHTEGLPGLYVVGEAALAEALAWSIEELRTVFAELQTLGMALADITARVIYLPNAIKYQPPCNPKHLQGWGKSYRRIPECSLRTRWLQKLYEFAQAKGENYLEAYRKGFDMVSDTVSDTVSAPHPHPHPNPKPNTLSGKPDDVCPESSEDIPYAEIVAYLNEQTGKRFRHGTAATKKHIAARWREGYRLEDFEQVIDIKVQEWRGTEFEKYLRPDTLFGSKFEGYLYSRGDGPGPQDSPYPDMDGQIKEELDVDPE